MWKKTIVLFVFGAALAGCGTNNSGTMDTDQRITPEVQEEMTEESHPGIPERNDGNGMGNQNNGGTNSKNSNNGNNNGMNGTTNNESINQDGESTLQTPDMDGNMYEAGLDDNR